MIWCYMALHCNALHDCIMYHSVVWCVMWNYLSHSIVYCILAFVLLHVRLKCSITLYYLQSSQHTIANLVMVYYPILHDMRLCFFRSYYGWVYHIQLYCNNLCCSALHYRLLYYRMFYSTIPWFAMLYHVVSC